MMLFCIIYNKVKYEESECCFKYLVLFYFRVEIKFCNLNKI